MTEPTHVLLVATVACVAIFMAAHWTARRFLRARWAPLLAASVTVGAAVPFIDAMGIYALGPALAVAVIGVALALRDQPPVE